MEKPKRLYSLYKRPTAKQRTFVYYCQFRNENGNYMSPISTLQFSKAAARNWADQKLNPRGTRAEMDLATLQRTADRKHPSSPD